MKNSSTAAVVVAAPGLALTEEDTTRSTATAPFWSPQVTSIWYSPIGASGSCTIPVKPPVAVEVVDPALDPSTVNSTGTPGGQY